MGIISEVQRVCTGVCLYQKLRCYFRSRSTPSMGKMLFLHIESCFYISMLELNSVYLLVQHYHIVGCFNTGLYSNNVGYVLAQVMGIVFCKQMLRGMSILGLMAWWQLMRIKIIGTFCIEEYDSCKTKKPPLWEGPNFLKILPVETILKGPTANLREHGADFGKHNLFVFFSATIRTVFFFGGSERIFLFFLHRASTPDD